MQTVINKFDSALNELLKHYFNDEELKELNCRMYSPEISYDKVSAKINEFYRNQLNISLDNNSDRFTIDRTITFSEKNLSGDNYFDFLVKLGHVCLAGGKLNFANEIFRKIKKNSNSESIRAEALLGMSDILSRRADWAKSLQLIDEASIIFNSRSDNKGLSKCENLRGTIFGERGDFDNARHYFVNSLALINPGDDLETAANLETNLGIIENIQGETEASITHLNNALNKYMLLNNQERIAEIKVNIGMVHYEAGQFNLALHSFDDTIEIAKLNGFYSILSAAYLNKAQTLIALGENNYAYDFAMMAHELGTSIDDKITIADAYKLKGIIARINGDFIASETYLLTSLRINISIENTMNIAETSFELGILYQERNEVINRNTYLNNSLTYFKKINAKSKAKKIESMLSNGFSNQNTI